MAVPTWLIREASSAPVTQNGRNEDSALIVRCMNVSRCASASQSCATTLRMPIPRMTRYVSDAGMRSNTRCGSTLRLFSVVAVGRRPPQRCRRRSVASERASSPRPARSGFPRRAGLRSPASPRRPALPGCHPNADERSRRKHGLPAYLHSAAQASRAPRENVAQEEPNHGHGGIRVVRNRVDLRVRNREAPQGADVVTSGSEAARARAEVARTSDGDREAGSGCAVEPSRRVLMTEIVVATSLVLLCLTASVTFVVLTVDILRKH
jgi:hypothetical protein